LRVNEDDGLYSKNIQASSDFMGIIQTSKKQDKLMKVGTAIAERNETISAP